MTKEQAIQLLLESKNEINFYHDAQIDAAYHALSNYHFEWCWDDQLETYFIELIEIHSL